MISEQTLSQITDQFQICMRCLGRVKGTKGSEQPDSALLAVQNLSLPLKNATVSSKQCEFCKGLVEQVLDLTPVIIGELEKYQFKSFLVGCSLPSHLQTKDKQIRSYNKNYNELKFEIRKEIGLRISNQLDVQVDFHDPDLTLVIDAYRKSYTLQVKSLYILGRYTKHTRGIPQTKWPCSHCKGRGCNSCDGTGQQYPKTVETLISPPFIEQAKAEEASFHGAGREDIDALMLGKGRPFVLELKSPHNRQLDLESLRNRVNQQHDVKIRDLCFTDKSMVVFLKEGSPSSSKTYRAEVALEAPVSNTSLKSLLEFGKEPQKIEQQTPLRVSHRRADKTREKIIYRISVIIMNSTTLELEIKAQGGAYIKEFISGDDGRTTPNVSSILGTGSSCTYLDVIAVDDRGVFE